MTLSGTELGDVVILAVRHDFECGLVMKIYDMCEVAIVVVKNEFEVRIAKSPAFIQKVGQMNDDGDDAMRRSVCHSLQATELE